MTASAPTLPPDEAKRVAALYRLHALDQPRRRDLDSLIRLAAHVCDVPMAALNLLDAQRQWPAAAFGWEPQEVSRGESMCAVSIQSRDVTYTTDASRDPRWVDNPHTTGEIASVKCYASAPLIVSGGEVVGTICAFDTETGRLSRTQVERLRDIADVAAQLLELNDETERLGQAAMRDSLTGLPNRALFVESLEHSIARTERGQSRTAVLFFDLDHFKTINDTHGHAAGDEVLREFAQRLVGAVRTSDLVARLGGDEFVLLCDGLPEEPDDVEALAARLRVQLTEPMHLTSVEGHPLVRVGVSIGTATADQHGGAGDLLLRADEAMYLDKAARRAKSETGGRPKATAGSSSWSAQ